MNLSRASWGPSASKCAKEALCLTTFLNFQKSECTRFAKRTEVRTKRASVYYVYDKVRMKTQISHSLSLSLSEVSGITNVYAFLSLLVLFHLFVLWLKIYARRVFSCVKESLCSEISLFI